MRRHLESAELQQPEPPPQRVGAVQLVDAELRAVGVAGEVGEQGPEGPVDQGAKGSEGSRRRDRCAQPLDLGEGDLQLVQRVRAALVHPRGLAGGADEPAGERVAQARMVLPVGEQADQQIGSPQQRRSRRLGPPSVQWLPPPVPCAGRRIRTSRAQAEFVGQPVHGGRSSRRARANCRPGAVDLQHPGVRGDRAGSAAVGRVAARSPPARGGVGFAGHPVQQADQLDELLRPFQRRQEQPDVAVARLGDEGRPRRGRAGDRPPWRDGSAAVVRAPRTGAGSVLAGAQSSVIAVGQATVRGSRGPAGKSPGSSIEATAGRCASADSPSPVPTMPGSAAAPSRRLLLAGS